MLATAIEPYAAIGITILIVGVITAAMLVLAHLIGPKRHGPVKDSPYESGVPVVMGARRRFHVRFYMVAVLYLLFGVEIVFLWPWVLAFHRAATTAAKVPLESGGEAGKGFLLIGMAVFFGLLVFGLLYEWKRGAFRWDEA